MKGCVIMMKRGVVVLLIIYLIISNIVYADKIETEVMRFDDIRQDFQPSSIANPDLGNYDGFSTHYGVYGKDSDDGSTVITIGESGEARFQYYFSGINNRTARYLVLQGNFCLNSGNVTDLYWGRDGSGSVSCKNKSIARNLNTDKWIYCVSVLDMESGTINGTTPSYNFNCKTYIDGVLSENTNSVSVPEKRLQLHIFGDAGSQVYADDLYVYQTDSFPDVTMPCLSEGENYSICDDSIEIIADNNVFVKDLLYNSQDIRGYENITMSKRLTDALPIRDGNIIVLEDERKAISYYTVELKGQEKSRDVTIYNDYGDYTYFNNHYCKIGENATYVNFAAYPKTNEVQLKRLENPKSVERKDYIYLNKTDINNDCFIDISLNRADFTGNKARIYQYILIDGKFRKDKIGSRDQIFLIRGEDKNGQTINAVPVYLNQNGDLEASDGRKIASLVKSGQGFRYTMQIDLNNHIIHVYFNGEEVFDGGVSINENLIKVKMVRYSLIQYLGNTYIDDFSVTGLEKPYTVDDTYHTSVFTDEINEQQFMKDKIGFNQYSDFMVVSGRKIKDGYDGLINDKQLYISTESVNKAFNTLYTNNGTGGIQYGDIAITSDGSVYRNGQFIDINVKILSRNNKVYLCVEDFARLMGKYVFTHKTGMIILSDYELTIDDEKWEYIVERHNSLSQINSRNNIDILNTYLTSYRPSQEEILEDYSKNIGSYDVHPRLLLNQNDFETLRWNYKNDTTYKRIADKIIATADQLYNTEPEGYEWDDQMRMLTTSEKLLDKFRYWGYAYQITGDSKYPERAYREFEAVAKFPDFNTAHIIDAGESLTAFAFGYDWLYEGYSKEQRAFILSNFYKKAYLPLSSGLYGGLTSTSNGTNSWMSFKQGTNFNAIINGGLMCASVAFMEYNPEYCADTISNSLKSVEYFMEGMMPDGGDSESLPYWNFAMQYIIYITEVSNKVFGTCYGIDNFQGFKNTIDYAIASIGTDGINNYHDSGTAMVKSNQFSYDTFSYLGKKFNNSLALAMRAYDVMNDYSVGFFDVLYYNRDYMMNYKEVLKNENYAKKISGIEMFSVMNSCDKDEGALYFSTHFGVTSGYHAHNDTGTFVLDMLGERWADDLGADNYLLQNEEGFSAQQLYRYRTEGHNTFTINNNSDFNQLTNKFVSIDKFTQNESSAYMVADTSDIYADVESMQMGYYIGDNKSTLKIRAEMVSNRDSEIYWFMHTRAKIDILNHAAYLTQNGKRIKLEFLCSDSNATISIMDAKPLESSGITEYGTVNSQYQKIAIRFNAKAGTSESLTVKISPVDAQCSEIDDTPIDKWELSDKIIYRNDANSLKKSDNIQVINQDGIKTWEINNKVIKAILKDRNGTISVPVSGNHKYYIINADVMPVSADLLAYPAEHDRWSKFTICVDKNTQQGSVFLNGLKIKDIILTIQDGYIQLPISASYEWGYLYLDNIYIYNTDTVITEKTSKSGIYDIVSGQKVSEVKKLGESVYVFSDSSGGYIDDEDYTLESGNIVLDINRSGYDYYTVPGEDERAGKVELIGEFSDSFHGLYTPYAKVENISGSTFCGKSSKDIFQKLTDTNASETDFYIQYSINSQKINKVITASIDIVPNESIASIRFNTRYHYALSKEIYISQLQKKRWNTIEMVYYPETKKSVVYVNGAKHSTYQGAEILDNQIRISFYKNQGYSGTAWCYADNVRFLSGECPSKPISTEEDWDGIYIYLENMNEEAIMKKIIPEGNYTTKIGDNDGTHMNLYVYSGDICIKKYIVNVGNVQMTASVANDNGQLFVDYSGKAYTNIELLEMLICEYDTDGKLTKVDLLKSHNVKGRLNFLYKNRFDDETKKVKIMLWNGKNLMPYSDCVTFYVES